MFCKDMNIFWTDKIYLNINLYPLKGGSVGRKVGEKGAKMEKRNGELKKWELKSRIYAVGNNIQDADNEHW